MTQPKPQSLDDLTNLEFLQAIFGEDWGNAHITGFPEPPDALNDIDTRRAWAGWLAVYHKTPPEFISSLNNFFCISTFHQQENEKPRRRKALHERTYCIVVDDVGYGEGSKVDPEILLLPEPSWKLETSKHNEQWGYILDPPEANAWRVDAMLDGLVAAGIAPAKELDKNGKVVNADPGMKGVTRYVRLPQGINNKAAYEESFQCKLREWAPGRIYSIDELAAYYDIDVQTEPQHVDHQSNPLPENDDPFLAALHEAGIFKSSLGKGTGIYDISCPWIESHSSRSDSGTAYLSPHGFKCHHGHCESKTFTDLHIWLEAAHPGLLTRKIIEGDAKRPKEVERPEGMPEVPPETDFSPIQHLTPEAFWGDTLPEQIVSGFLFRGRSHNLNGPNKGGKTYLSIQLAMCTATGTAFLGMPVQQSPVVYYSLEMPASSLAERMREIHRDLGIPLPEIGKNLFVVAGTKGSKNPDLSLTSPEQQARLRKHIEDVKPGIVIFDTMYKFTLGKELDHAAQAPIYAWMGDTAQELDFAAVALDHTRKGRQGKDVDPGPASESGLGAQIKGGAASSIWDLRRRSGAWELHVDSHFGSFEHPLHLQRPDLGEGKSGCGFVQVSGSEAAGMDEGQLRALFARYGEVDDTGKRFFGSARKMKQAILDDEITSDGVTAQEMASSIAFDYSCKTPTVTPAQWQDLKPIWESVGPRSARIFTWREVLK